MLVAAREAGVGVTQEEEQLTRHWFTGSTGAVRGGNVEVDERREGSTRGVGSELDGLRFELEQRRRSSSAGGGVHGPLFRKLK